MFEYVLYISVVFGKSKKKNKKIIYLNGVLAFLLFFKLFDVTRLKYLRKSIQKVI